MTHALETDIFCAGFRARVHRAAWHRQDGYDCMHYLEMVGPRPILTAIAAALVKQKPDAGELSRMIDEQWTHIATIRRRYNSDRDPIRYRRIIQAMPDAPGVAQCVIWSSHTEDQSDTPAAIAIGRTRDELRESVYRRLNRRTIVPLREQWTRRLLACMVEDGYAERIGTLNIHAVRLNTPPSNYLTEQIAEHIEKGSPA